MNGANLPSHDAAHAFRRNAALPQPSRFLQRDLNEKALRQPAEPSFGSLDVADARQQGFEAGRIAGLQDAALSQAAQHADALSRIAASLSHGQAEAGRVAEAAAAALARTLVAAMAAVMPELIRRSALMEAGAMLAHLLPGLSREPAVRAELPGPVAAGVAALVAQLVPDQGVRFDVVAQDGMAAGDVRVSWSSGQARRQADEVWASVMEALEPVLRSVSNEGQT